MELGHEIGAPTREEWEAVLVDCEVLELGDDDASRGVSNVDVAKNVEALASMALKYEPADLEELAKAMAERKVGCVEVHAQNYDLYGASSAVDRQQQGMAVALLVKHLAQHPQNCEALEPLQPALDQIIRKQCAVAADPNAPAHQGLTCWYSVLEQQCLAFAALVQGCEKYTIKFSAASENTMVALGMPRVPADDTYRWCKEMVEEKKLHSRGVSAQQHLKEAFGLYQSVSA